MADARSHPILYERPSVPDNQTSGLRLADLENITAPNGPCVPYSSLLLDVLPLVQQTAATLCFVAVFLHLHQGLCDVYLVGAGTMAFYACAWFLLTKQLGSRATRLVISTVNLAALLALVVPVLRTLTQSTADNTIAPFSGLCFIASLALADYSRDSPSSAASASKAAQSPESTTFKAIISLNAAISGATILSSRLQSNLQGFVLLFLAIGHFGLFPLVKHVVSLEFSTPVLVLLQSALMYNVMPMVALYAGTLQLALFFLVPLILQQAIAQKKLPQGRLWITAPLQL